MKKIFLTTVFAVLLVMLTAVPVLADSPTEFNMSWSGSGGADADVTAGDDASTGFSTFGDAISGTYYAKDSNDNPYGYGVDSFQAEFQGSVTNGMMITGGDRTDSKSSSYGPAGQSSFSGVEVIDGNAQMAYRTTTNYAQMRDCSYAHQLSGGHNIVVNSASFYYLERWIDDGQGNDGYLMANGDGNATLDCMSAEASGCWNLKLGHGCGCYTDANFNATGTGGHFEVSGTGNNNVTFHGFGASSGGGTLSFIADWLGGFSVNDYSLSAN